LLLGAGLLHDRLDEALADLNLGVVADADDEAVVLHVGDDAVHPAGRDDLVARLQRVSIFSCAFCFRRCGAIIRK
jgi:hypothetical protein